MTDETEQPDEPTGGTEAPAAPEPGLPSQRATATRRTPAAMRRRRLRLLRRILRAFVLGKFGWVFAIGVAMITAWATILILLSYEDAGTSKAIFKMTITQIFTGRASGIAVGKKLDLSILTLIFTASYVDIMVVFTIFPFIAFGYRNLARLGVFGNIAGEAVGAAEESRPAVAKWGLVGLFFFVVFPFYFTGPLIGSVIGFFIGLPLVLNLFVVTSGTIVAIMAWVLVFDYAYKELERAGPWMPLMVVVLIVGVAILVRVRAVMKSRGHTDSGVLPAVGGTAKGGAPEGEAGAGPAPPEESPEKTPGDSQEEGAESG